MFTKKSNIDLKKSTAKIQDSKKDSTARLRHLKTILEHVDSEEAKNLFEANYSHVYYILYDTFVQAEANLRQRVHKTHREELDGSLWLLSKILTLLPELIARRWQVHSLGRILAKLLHYGNSVKLRREGVRYFLLWYQALGDNAPPFVDGMFTELVPGLTVPQKGRTGPLSSDSEYIATSDILNHPNMKGELGGSVFHDTGAHPVKSPEIQPLIPPSSSERTAAPDPRDGLEILLDCMVQSSGCLKWRDNNPQKHIRTLNFLLTKFREQYLPVFCPNFDYSTSIYEPKLDLPAMRNISKREEVMSSCIVVLVIWIAKYTHERHVNSKLDNLQIDEEVVGESASLLSNLRHMGYTQTQLVRDVLYSSRDTINFVHEIYRQAFLMSFTSKSQIEAMRIAISVYRDWMSTIPPPPFLLEPDTSEASLSGSSVDVQNPGARPTNQRLRTDSYLGAISKENVIIRAGLQNVLQVFVTNAVNVFMINTAHLNIHFQSKTNSDGFATPLDEQTDICKRVLNIYRTMVMKTRMEAKTWEQLLLVLLQVTSVILQNSPPNAKKNNLGGRLAQPIFQTLIVTWIRAHTNVVVNPGLWDKFLKVLSSLTHREELIVEWDKTMQTLTRVLARQVYNINLSDLPLDRLAEQKGKRKRGTPSNWTQNSSTSQSDKPDNIIAQCISNGKSSAEEAAGDESRVHGQGHSIRSIPGTPSLNRSYSEGSLAPFRKSRARRRIRNKHQAPNSQQHVAALPMNVEHSLNRMLSNASAGGLSISNENLDISRFSHCDESLVMGVPTLRRALSLDSIRPTANKHRGNVGNDTDSYRCGSRSPSPTASSGIESGSIKDSPMQIDVLTADSSSIDTQDENSNVSADRRSILAGGTARGWLPDVAAVMWRRMLGALGDVNKILNPKLHAQVFQYLVNMTESLIKIRMNQGISLDGQPIPVPLNLVPPVALVAPWCYGALTLDGQYSQGKLYAMQLLCTIVKSGACLGNNQFPLFYHALHQALSGEDRAMAYTALRYLGGPRFLSLLLPGHTLLLLDLVHAATIVLTSSETGSHAPRAQVAGLLGSLLCFPKTSLPGPVLQPSEPNIDLMECPDLQEHVLNIVLRCARREPTAKARSIAIASLGQWILQNLTNPSNQSNAQSSTTESSFKQRFPQHHSSSPHQSREDVAVNPRIREAFQVILQALQFKHRTIARLASETLKLCAEQGHRIERIDRLPQLIIDTLCLSLEIQNVPHPKDSDKTVLTSLLLTLGEFCMSFSVQTLQRPKAPESDEPLIQVVFKVLYKIAMGIHNGERIKLFTTDEDFDMTITVDDVREQSASMEASYQTSESVANCQSAIRLCAKTVAMHLITNLGHFPMGIGATRLSSLVDEQDDLTGGSTTTLQRENSVMSNRDSMDLGASQVLASPNLQLLMLSSELVASFIELPALKLPGGGATAGLITANRQVRLLLRDLNGKACWDASILYKEPSPAGEDNSRLMKDNSPTAEKHNSTFQLRGGSGSSRMFPGVAASIDPMTSTVGLPMAPLRHTLRHRPVHQLPVAKDLAPDLDQLDDLLQYIGYTSPECLDANGSPLNTAGPSPLGPPLEGQTISIILNQRAIETEYIARQNAAVGLLGESPAYSFGGSVGYTSFIDDNAPPAAIGSSGTLAAANRFNTSQTGSDRTSGSSNLDVKPFQFGRILFSQLGLAGWERRKRTHLLQRTDKLLRELRNLDNQKCRETHKMAVIYVANGQEDKNSILRNSCGSSTYEMFVSALGWEVELESHNGFLGGLPRQGCGQTAPYYATPFLEVIFHVSTRMPSDTPEAILNKTRHLGNDEVHIVWSEHNRDYRRDILPTEFCDVLIVIYPLKSGLFRVTVNKKPDVPWFGPLSDEVVVGGSCLASLVRASAINASRAKRTSLSLYQQYYEERNRSLDTVAMRHKENNTFEDFTARIFSPIPPQGTVTGGAMAMGGGVSGGSAPLAAALIDHHSRTSSKTWIHHPEMVATAREVTQQTVMASSGTSLDQPSPRPLRKLHHTFKPSTVAKQPPKLSAVTTVPTGGTGGIPTTLPHHHHHYPSSAATPPESPTLPGRTKFK